MTAPAEVETRPLDYPEPPVEGMKPGPNLRQALAHTIECDELLFGGARGGGKTSYAIAETLCLLHEFPGMKAAIFRRSYPELTQAGGVVERLLKAIPSNVADYKAGPPPRWEFTNGSTLWAAHLTTIGDVSRFLGGEYQLFVFEQAEQIDELTYRLLAGSLRVSGDLAARMRKAGYRPRRLLTANPGGPGNDWLRERFIDPFPTGEVVFKAKPTEDEPTSGTRCFIPSFLSDNPALEIGDPSYRERLEALPPDERAAQLEGDWYQHKGTRFRHFSAAKHVIDPEDMPIPLGAAVPRALGIDYGSTNPFVGLWGAVMQVDGESAYVVYREVSETGLSPREQALLLLDSEAPGERDRGRPVPSFLDPSCWAPPPDKPAPRTAGSNLIVTGPPPGSIADTYQRNGLRTRKADNRRIEGAALISDLLTVRSDGRPRLYIYSTCTNLIRTLPQLPRDPKRPEDVKKNDKDHWYDALRYLLMHLAGRMKVEEEAESPVMPSYSGGGGPSAELAGHLPALQKLRTLGF